MGGGIYISQGIGDINGVLMGEREPTRGQGDRNEE